MIKGSQIQHRIVGKNESSERKTANDLHRSPLSCMRSLTPSHSHPLKCEL